MYSSHSFFFYGKTVDIQYIYINRKYNTLIDDLS
jgi:hypothetical protein